MSHDHGYLGGFDRRTFLKTSLGAATAIGAPGLGLRAAFAQDGTKPGEPKKRIRSSKAQGFGKAKHVIVLYMRGGASHLDTFDPKPGQATGGPFKAIETSAPGMKISEHLPRLAKNGHRFSIVRSMNSREGSHERAMYQNTTGYIPAGPVRHPDFGAIVASECGKRDFDLPSFVSVGGGTVNGGGFLGVEFAPFVVNNPGALPENLSYPKGVDGKRFKRRWDLLRGIEKTFGKGRSPALINGHKNMIEKASKFMHSPRLKAFDVMQEKDVDRKRYGDNRFGKGVLVARRLVEVGVPFVQVNLGGWDTHRNNFESVQRLSGMVDPAFSSLLEDLDDRKLLDETLILWIGDFGRTPKINANNGRDHYPRAWSFAMAGGGIKGGRVHGATNADGTQVAKDEVKPVDLFATMSHCLGLERGKENFSSAGRPISLVDVKGKLLTDLVS
jgi:hypothetical protein